MRFAHSIAARLWALLRVSAALARRLSLVASVAALTLFASVALFGGVGLGLAAGLLLSAGLLIQQAGLTRHSGAKLLAALAALGLFFLLGEQAFGPRAGPLDLELFTAAIALPTLLSLGAMTEAAARPVAAWLVSWGLSLLLLLLGLGALYLVQMPAPQGLGWLLGTQPVIAAAAVSASAGATREGRGAGAILLLVGAGFALLSWGYAGRPQPLAPLLGLWLFTPVLLARAAEWTGGEPRPVLKRLCGLVGLGLELLIPGGFGLPVAGFVLADALSEPLDRRPAVWARRLRSPAALGLFGALVLLGLYLVWRRAPQPAPRLLGQWLWGLGLFLGAARLGRRALQPLLLACVLAPPIFLITAHLGRGMWGGGVLIAAVYGAGGLLLASWALLDRVSEAQRGGAHPALEGGSLG